MRPKLLFAGLLLFTFALAASGWARPEFALVRDAAGGRLVWETHTAAPCSESSGWIADFILEDTATHVLSLGLHWTTVPDAKTGECRGASLQWRIPMNGLNASRYRVAVERVGADAIEFTLLPESGGAAILRSPACRLEKGWIGKIEDMTKHGAVVDVNFLLAESKDARSDSPAQAHDDLALARKVAGANNAFGVALYREFAKEEKGNLVFSPFSLSSALALTASGARGETERELWRALHLDLPRETVALGYAGMAQAFRRAVREDLAELTVANSLWPRQGCSLRPDFLTAARDQFAAEVLPLDYARPDAAADQINAWIKTKTAGLISDVISPVALTPQTRLTLCNAVHFKATWAQDFAEEKTKPAAFTLLDRQRIQVPMMRQTAWFPVAKAAGCRLLRLPYAGGFEMVVVLPRRTAGLAELERTLSAEKLAEWLGAIDSATTDYLALELPKFKTSAQPDCMKALKQNGVTAAFDRNAADFSGISSDPGLAVGEVLQKSVIDVNEQGTEAVAEGYVVCLALGGGEPKLPTPKPFKVDHPFLFLIRETRTGAILFMGRIIDPRVQ